MVSLNGELNVRRSSMSVRLFLYRSAYLFGSALRLTVDGVLYPYRIVAGKQTARKNPMGSRGVEIVTKLNRMKDRLQIIESRLFGGAQEKGDRRQDAGNTGKVSIELEEALTNPDPGIRGSALGNIGEFAGEEETVLILESLHDPDPGVRGVAAIAAARARAFGAVFSLILLLDDPSTEVRKAAKVAIERITGNRVKFDLNQETSARKKKIEKLKNWWKEERFSRLAKEVKTALKL
jgi:hypothetical protein